jgi:hypothetical protein
MSEMNKIELLTISKLLDKNFYIPSYQRGYRWTKQQVEDLLNDINTFKIEDNSWYCLQPLVVKKMTIEEIKINELFESIEWFEVIDGQQRLTTIFLFIHYFNEKWIGEDKLLEPNIQFQTRQSSTSFLTNLKIDNTSNIVTSGDFEIDSNIDFEHISNAYKVIREWVIKEKDLKKNSFQEKFQFNTQVIWYEINDNSNPIDTFIRINLGKIPLTNSELVKALFLQKRNFDNSTAELRQIEIANEWDNIEFTLQNDDFWWFLNKDQNELSARIEYIFDMMCAIAKNLDKTLPDRIGSDKYTTFRFFNEKFSGDVNIESVMSTWNDVKSYFFAFEEWFNEPIWYHYIGFLISCGKPIVDIYNLYKDCSKDLFLGKLKSEIKEIFKNINCIKLITDDNVQFIIELPYENKNKQKIKELLLMFNIEYIVKQYESVKGKENVEIHNLFPFELFKKGKWDIEHIDSYTQNEIKDRRVQIEWLQMALPDIKDKLDTELITEIEYFINNKSNSKQFVDLKIKIIEKLDESENNEEVKNSIGNLTLLDSQTNRGYGNALFPTKRRIIIEKDTNGKFIPICTKNVFLKYFDKRGYSRTQWTAEDIDNYQSHIGLILEDFLTFKIEHTNG